jgi:hypothetical protein
MGFAEELNPSYGLGLMGFESRKRALARTRATRRQIEFANQTHKDVCWRSACPGIRRRPRSLGAHLGLAVAYFPDLLRARTGLGVVQMPARDIHVGAGVGVHFRNGRIWGGGQIRSAQSRCRVGIDHLAGRLLLPGGDIGPRSHVRRGSRFRPIRSCIWWTVSDRLDRNGHLSRRRFHCGWGSPCASQHRGDSADGSQQQKGEPSCSHFCHFRPPCARAIPRSNNAAVREPSSDIVHSHLRNQFGPLRGQLMARAR